MNFAESLAIGKVGEGLIAKYMMSRGNSVLPVYEIEKATGKGPQLFFDCGEYVAPDMIVFTDGGVMFIEAKHKSVFSWHRKSMRWTTGIDLRHYEDYLLVSAKTKTPVWLLFYHKEDNPSANDLSFGCPNKCPTGLYGGNLAFLVSHENHRSLPYDFSRGSFVGHGKSGMVYWSENILKKIATKEEVELISAELAK